MSEYPFLIMHLSCLSFKQHVFLQASGMMKMLTSFAFSSESWKKHKRCFQTVCDKCIIKNEYSRVTFLERLLAVMNANIEKMKHGESRRKRKKRGETQWL
ncbi:hypothetical protein [[Clostridium] fimetarium]|uniref:Uncharacterized protein n=1 Tax=[Clostridium] fimetarium TaxID=99656 RepID=A0A1I0RMP9_9FIRM|nr:hypothetical protein [[Clostridium] fimetarium]SEW42479.1 hypothetical protein SAMN05421659_11930 [[Clostridium] fimetarium]